MTNSINLIKDKFTKHFGHINYWLIGFTILFSYSNLYAQDVSPYTGIDYATDYTNPDMGSPCASIAGINAAIGDADFVNGSAEVPLGWSFSGTWNSGSSYVDGPGDEVLLVSLHTYTESWNVALRLSDGSTTAFMPYDLTIVTSDASGSLATCGGISPGPFNYERPCQLLDFADYVIPDGEGVIGIVFEPFSDGAGNPDPHGVLILEGTEIESPCEGETPTSYFEFLVGETSSEDGATGACVTTPIQFNDLSEVADPNVIETWSWDFGDGDTSTDENPTHTYGAPGSYTVTLTVTTDGGCSETFELTIIMTEGLALELIFNNPTCFGYSDGSVTVNVLDGTGELEFEITDSDGTLLNIANSNTSNELPTGWYYINVSDDSDCGGIDSVFLDEPGEIDIDLSTFDVACFGDETGWAEVDNVVNFTGDYDAISYFWNPNPVEIEGIDADSIWALSAGNYTVTINDENGCSNIFDFEILEPTELVVDIDFNPALCRTFGYQNGNGVVYGTAEGGTPDYDYLWTNLDNGDEYINTTVGGLNPGNFEFTVTDGNGCVTVGTVFLDSINPVAAFTVNSAQLNADCQGTANVVVEFINESYDFALEDDPTSDTTFFWNLNSPNNSYEITHSYEYRPDTTYFAEGETYQIEVCLIAFNKNDCQDEACKIITVYEPIKFTHVNIFSPNGDGKNDLFTFEFTSASISQFECVIVNRWGVIVHEMTSITDGWDGTDRNGDQVKDGTYFYTYKAITDDKTEMEGQGTITLVGGK